jgi:peroxidase
MASSRVFSRVALALLLFVVANGDDLSSRYYDKTCPNVQGVVRSVMAQKVASEPRMAPAILRLFFHDCFVNVRITLTCPFPPPAIPKALYIS